MFDSFATLRSKSVIVCGAISILLDSEIFETLDLTDFCLEDALLPTSAPTILLPTLPSKVLNLPSTVVCSALQMSLVAALMAVDTLPLYTDDDFSDLDELRFAAIISTPSSSGDTDFCDLDEVLFVSSFSALVLILEDEDFSEAHLLSAHSALFTVSILTTKALAEDDDFCDFEETLFEPDPSSCPENAFWELDKMFFASAETTNSA